MESVEFKIFLKKLKHHQKISQKRFGEWCGYSQVSLINFANNKKPVPRTLEIIVKDLQFKEQIGIDITKIIKIGATIL